jgi:predicted O-methyltransferase YrrM
MPRQRDTNEKMMPNQLKPSQTSLDELLSKKGLKPGPGYEGYSQQIPDQVATLRTLLKEKKPKRILEIGFNAGHSAEVFLSTDAGVHLLSFDLGHVPAVNVGKAFIDAHFPLRHTLIIGDSTGSVPAFTRLYPDAKFDLIFIDGGHQYEVAKADIENCMKLADAQAIVAVDDTIFTASREKPYTVGPTKAWLEALQERKVTELGRQEYAIGRGMVWGRYNFA